MSNGREMYGFISERQNENENEKPEEYIRVHWAHDDLVKSP